MVVLSADFFIEVVWMTIGLVFLVFLFLCLVPRYFDVLSLSLPLPSYLIDLLVVPVDIDVIGVSLQTGVLKFTWMMISWPDSRR